MFLRNLRKYIIGSVTTGAAAAGITTYCYYNPNGAIATNTGGNTNNIISDVVIIGGGVVGLAVAREFAIREKSVIVLEKEDTIITGASSGNSGIGCTGYDAPANSLERKLLRRSIIRHPNLYRSLGLSYDHVRKCGALVVAWNQKELKELPNVLQENIDAGDTESTILNKNDLLELEPSINKNALGAVFANREMVTEPWLVPVAYAYSAILHGAKIFVNKEVIKADFNVRKEKKSNKNDDNLKNGTWTITTKSKDIYETKQVINCAGINGDTIHHELMRNNKKNDDDASSTNHQFRIQPRKGQFVVFKNVNNGIAVDGDCSNSNTDISNDNHNIESKKDMLLPSIVIQPVPSRYTKGVIVWKSVYGNIIVGPTAEEQESRTDRSNDKETIDMLTNYGRKIIPALKDVKVIGSYSGIRTATEYRDYQIYSIPNMNWITVGGIRSTGLTAASGIAEYIYLLYSNGDEDASRVLNDNVMPPFLPSLPLHPKPKYDNPRIPSLSSLRDNYNQRGDGTIKIFGQIWKVTHPLSIFGLGDGGM